MQEFPVRLDAEGKTPVRSTEAILRVRLGKPVPSQVTQELPAQDRKAWAAEMLRPEHADENAERRVRDFFRRNGSAGVPGSLAFARAWAARRIAGLLVLAAVALPGCGLPLGRLLGDDDQPTVVTIAHYQPLLPGYSLGQDGVGNVWVREDASGRCLIQTEPGIVREFTCPAEGDTLYSGGR